jgi:hypothetical protein
MANATPQRIGYHIAVTAYAEWFFRAGYFDEILLFLDCPREAFPSAPLIPPHFQTVTNPAAHERFRYFYAFATRWGRHSRERPMSPDGRFHGVFTTALLAGLNGAAADTSGQITGASLRNYLSAEMRTFLDPAGRRNPSVAQEPDFLVYPHDDSQLLIVPRTKEILPLTGREIEALCKALCRAFDEESLTQMIRFEFDEKLDEIVEGGPLRNRVFKLIEYYEQLGTIEQLIHAVCKRRPNHPLVVAFMERHIWGVVTPANAAEVAVDSIDQRHGFWRPGQQLRILFMDGDPAVQEKVFGIATQWTSYANIQLERRNDPQNDPQAEVRVSFKERGFWSRLGTWALTVSGGQPTMNLGWLTRDSSDEEYERIVLHEFGRALGLLDERNNPKANINWDQYAVYRELSRSPNNWSKRQVDSTLFYQAKQVASWYRDFDPYSVMMYPIPATWTLDGWSMGINSKLSESDKAFIRLLYPPDRPLRALQLNNEWLAGEIKEFRQFDRLGFTANAKGNVTLGVECDADIMLSVSRTAPEDKPVDSLSGQYEKEHQVTWTLEAGDYLLLVWSSQLGGQGHYKVRLATQPL